MNGRFSQRAVYRELLQSREFYRIALAGALALAGFLWEKAGLAPTALAAVLPLCSVALNGLPILWGAAKGLKERKVNVDELVSLAIVACLLKGEFLAAAVVSFVMVAGALVEEATSDSARKAVRALMETVPECASVVVAGRVETVPVDRIRAGDILLIKPGERVPADGIVRKGMTAVDESSMTGESIPVERAIGDPVVAGTLNLNGVVEIEATRVGEETTLSKVARLVAEAENDKPKATRLADRYARWFTPAILACSAIAWLLTRDADRAITVLVVGCPCALVLAVPTAIVAAIGRAARSGILVKGGGYLEEAGRADVVLYDKTGTLTEGKPVVRQIFACDGVDTNGVVALAACVEQHSTHPLAWAVMKAAADAKVAFSPAEETCTDVGIGIRGRVAGSLIEVGSAFIGGSACMSPVLLEPVESLKRSGATPLIVYKDKRPIGVMGVADRIRPAAADTVRQLRSLGIGDIGILSGDHEKSVRFVADAAGITSIWSTQSPRDKLTVIANFQSKGKTVMFIGDGVNDAPALAAANVGIAMAAAGTHVALETADIALLHDDISKIPFLIGLSRKMLRIIKWNIAFGMLFNLAAILASGSGLLNPITGAVAHNVGSVLVVISSASLAFVGERGGCPSLEVEQI